MPQLYLYNTLTRSKEPFHPLENSQVKLYTCGPTVYHYAHIGNMRYFVATDVLKRTLLSLGYSVTHVMNITDVGHLQNDADDTGEDKLDLGAKREGKTPQQIAKFYTDAFFADFHALNNEEPTLVPRATEHIPEMIAAVKTLLEKGYAYETDQAIYYSVEKFTGYEKLSGQSLQEKAVAARDDIVADPNKKHPADFALWFKAVGHHANHSQVWDSPWGKGFPGWHIECSAMAQKYLGDTFDIHTGGVDLIGTHHTNEIAQSEAITGKPLAHVWFHVEHLNLEGAKMSKSSGEFVTVADLKQQGIDPLAFRYILLTAHYRSKMTFSWEALKSAQKTLASIRRFVQTEKGNPASPAQRQAVEAALFDDLDTPRAIALLHEAKSPELWKIFDAVLGIKVTESIEIDLPDQVAELVKARDKARTEKDWHAADVLRNQIQGLGYTVLDTSDGTKVSR